MTHVRNNTLNFNNLCNLQVFLTELGTDNKNNSKNTRNIEVLVTYGVKKKILLL